MTIKIARIVTDPSMFKPGASIAATAHEQNLDGYMMSAGRYSFQCFALTLSLSGDPRRSPRVSLRILQNYIQGGPDPLKTVEDHGSM